MTWLAPHPMRGPLAGLPVLAEVGVGDGDGSQQWPGSLSSPLAIKKNSLGGLQRAEETLTLLVFDQKIA